MFNVFHSRGVVGLALLFCSSTSLFLGVMGICLVRVWNYSPWENPSLWSGLTGLLAGMLGIASSRLNSAYWWRFFIISCGISILTTCSGLGVLIVQFSTISRSCRSAQEAQDTDCNRKLTVLSGFTISAMLSVLLFSLVGISFWGKKQKMKTTVRVPEQGIVLVSTPHCETHQTLVPVKCQYVTKTTGKRDSVLLAPWTLPSSTPGYSNRLSTAFNVSFNAGGPAFENSQSRYVALD